MPSRTIVTSFLALACLFSLPVGAQDRCAHFDPDDPNLLHHEGEPIVHVALSEEPRVGEPFDLHLTPCVDDATILGVDATMPDHGHGMNYKPELTHGENGTALANGFLLHMPGHWNIRVSVNTTEGPRDMERELALDP